MVISQLMTFIAAFFLIAQAQPGKYSIQAQRPAH